MSQEERNRLALTCFIGAKVANIGAVICAFIHHYNLGIGLFGLAVVCLTISISLAWQNFSIQAKEEWKS